MLFKIKEEHKAFIRVFITYGIHLWLLIFVCNVVIFYSVRFFINASTNRTANVKSPTQTKQNPSGPSSIPTTVPTAVGPVVDLSFSLPGIGTNGGNLKPLNTSRNVSVYLFSSDANTSDKNVKPVYTIKTQATYDADPNSPTYTFFVNKYVDLGAVPAKNYQIAIQTPQSLQSLIKSSDPRTIGGQLFELSNRRFLVLPTQSMIIGDIYPLPGGDNFMDINDYNMLVNCYSIQINSSKCADAAPADLDDNGVVDGIDYNILLMNFRTLLSLGFPVPTIIVSPSGKPITPIVSVTPQKDVTPTPAPEKSSSKSPFGAIIIFMLFIILVGIIAFVSYKFHLLNILFPKKGEDQSEAQTSPDAQSADPVDQANQPPDRVTDQADSKTPATDAVEKTGYLKKVKVDEQAKGTWVTLADDTGINRAFCPNVNVVDGFVSIKGTMKNDDENKPYIFITELNTEE